MKAVTKIIMSGAAVAALVSTAPAAAQYGGYGAYGNGYGYPGYQSNNVVGNILNSLLGGRNYAANDRQAIDMCVRATEARLNGYQGGYGYNGYGSYGGYGNNGYANGYNGARVTSITNLERRSSGSVRVYGLATRGGGYGGGYNNGYGNGYNNGYGGGYNQGYAGQLRFSCKVDRYGRVVDVNFDRRY